MTTTNGVYVPGHAQTTPERRVHGGRRLIAAEFFAGIGLVRCGLEQAGIDVIWANDIEPTKRAVYAANFDASHYLLGDIRSISEQVVPTVDLAAASFPCVDLSLAGHRRGLGGEQSGLFYEFTRVLREMTDRLPRLVLVENVASFVSSRNGKIYAPPSQNLTHSDMCAT